MGKKIRKFDASWHLRIFAVPLLYDYPELCLPNAGLRDGGHGVEMILTLTDLRNSLLKEKQEGRWKQKQIAYPLQISGNHFILVFIDQEEHTLEYYDSKATPNKLVSEIAQILSKNAPDSPYRVINKVTKKLQFDGRNCGAWVCFFLEKRLQDPEFNFNSLHDSLGVEEINKMIALYRNRVLWKISKWLNVRDQWRKNHFQHNIEIEWAGYTNQRQQENPRQFVMDVIEEKH